MVGPGRKRAAVVEVVEEGLCSLRAACRALRLSWSSFCYRAKKASDQALRLAAAIIDYSKRYPRYGYRRIRALLIRAGWTVSRKLVQRIRRAEGLGVKPPKPRRHRRGASTGKHPTRALHPHHVWSWDFVASRTDQGAPLRILSLIDEHTRQCLSLTVARQLKSVDIITALQQAIAQHGAPGHIRSDNGPEFISKTTQAYLIQHQIKTLYIEPGSPWQNGHVESFHNRLQDECLKAEHFLSVAEAQGVIEDWRQTYNQIHPHSRLGFLSPQAFATLWKERQKIQHRVVDSGRPPASLHQRLTLQTT